MNPEAQELLQKILNKNPQDLTPDEGVFLRARSTYLNDLQKKTFKSILQPAGAASNQVKADGAGKKNNPPAADEPVADPTPPADNPDEPVAPAAEATEQPAEAQAEGDVINGQSQEPNPYGGGDKDPDQA